MILWLNPVAGVSGDMLLGALLDLGASMADVRAAISSTGITGWELRDEKVTRGPLSARRAVVDVDDSTVDRSASHLLELVAQARPASVAEVAVTAVRRLAEVEAVIHGTTAEDVHLHELGGVDTVVDFVGVAAALTSLRIEEVWSAPIAVGSGTTSSLHGVIPVPAPATLALLQGAPVYMLGPAGETVTPSGAALLAAVGCRYGPTPELVVRATGYGAGSRDPAERPNVLPAVLGERWEQPPAADAGVADKSALDVVETTVDDVTGEVIAATIDRLLAIGAKDAWAQPIIGKKGRPAVILSALSEPESRESVIAVIAAETGTLGVRWYPVARRAYPRYERSVEVGGHSVRVKVGPHYAKPEHDDVAAAAAILGVPLRAVAALALSKLSTGDN